MRILLVTGKQAEKLVREIVGKTRTRHQVSVVALPITVAALASTEFIAKQLVKMGVKKSDYDLIVVPGMCQGSTSVIEEATGIKAVKGTLYATDIPVILSLEDPSVLSREEPADKILENNIIEVNKRIIAGLEEELASGRRKYVSIGGLRVPINPPPIRIVSEVSDCHLMDRESILEKVARLFKQGADIVSLGFEAGNPRPDYVYSTVRFVKENIDKPIAIDSIIPSEIKMGVKAGADLVLSIELGNINEVAEYLREEPFVVIPFDSRTNTMPSSTSERTRLLERIITIALSKGLENIIGDLVLDPPIVGSILDTLVAYRDFKKKYPEIPLLMGVGNVSELMDVDTHGVNALLTILGLEAGVSLLLVVEKSVKAQGSTFETKIASQMASIAYAKKAPPKDLGIDLLMLKDKRRIETPLDAEGALVVDVTGFSIEHKPDPQGFFKIRVNHRENTIEALYVGRKGRILIKAKNAESICDYIVREGLVSALDHAMYLGRELEKAEEALILGKNYYQEKPLFTRKKPL